MDEYKYTAVIPTLWKSKRIHQLLKDLAECDEIREIILIDNSQKFWKHYPNGHPKTTLVVPPQNLFVNPSWNIGVREAKNENIAILGDDANFDTNIFKLINGDVLDACGIIGMDSSCYHNPTADMFIRQWMGEPRPWGWGCVMLLKKKYWLDIPEDILVWYGDDYIMHCNRAPKAILHNFPIHTEMSTTSDMKEFDEIKRNDKENYEKHLKGTYEKTAN